MCDIEVEHLIAEFRKAAATFKPWDVLKWNGMSWDYLTMALAAEGVDEKDRADLVRFARKAVIYAAGYELGVWKMLKARWNKTNPIEVMASLKLPPEPSPTGYGEHEGLKFAVVPEDTHRIQRRRAIAATVLLKVEKDPDWHPTPAEFEAIARMAGARVRETA